ncbi:MAG TPA: hypothetical protein VMR95_00870 [Candidatus Binatia bacterium]|nr:hypothetical protein [Candidatus Binatia bacterium]
MTGERISEVESSIAQRADYIQETLTKGGWFCDGGPAPARKKPSRVHFTLWLFPGTRLISGEAAASALGLYDDNGELLPEWELPEESDTRLDKWHGDQVQLGFTGHIAHLEQMLEPMLDFARPHVEPQIALKG